jgi:exosortase A-associated hydrolase 2
MARLEAFFLEFERGHRFALLHRPPRSLSARGAVLFVHPFAEEMNRSRRMAALQSRALARAGWLVLQMDLFGCGDSTATFDEATWAQWLDDVGDAAAWLQRTSGHVPVLWGLRAGALLALQCASSIARPTDLVLWEPPASGRELLREFLRLKVVSRMMNPSSGERVSIEHLLAQLAEGNAIDIAGYALSAPLAFGLDAATCDLNSLPGRIACIEISATASGALSRGALDRAEGWRKKGHEVQTRAIAGVPFWQTPEISECPALIENTIALLETWN